MMVYLYDDTIRFYIILLACIALVYIPFIGKYVRLISTMIHEGGHVLMGLLLGERIVKVNLFSDASGEANVTVSNKFKKLLIAIVGYPSTALMAFFSFWLISEDYHYYYVIGITALFFIFLLLYIRNLFGVFWALSFVIANALLLYYQQLTFIHILAQVYACIIFVESIFSCFILLYISFVSPKTQTDATNISDVIYLPKQLVAVLITAFNLYFAYLSVMYFFPNIN